MNKHDLQSLAGKCATQLQAIDYESLPISEYNREYIRRMCPALPHYMKIYAQCLHDGLQALGRKPEEITLVDFGGGSGFLSILAGMAGFGRVIYVDHNPLSVEAAIRIGREAGASADFYRESDSAGLLAWCREEGIRPDLLLSTDVIEHVYDLQALFDDLHRINPAMSMIFTTASTPYNPYIIRRLHRFMQDCEDGRIAQTDYLVRRRTFLAEQAPRLSAAELDEWAARTRGMTFDGIRKALEAGILPVPTDGYNTCNPETGNWAERILPLSAYRQIASPDRYSLSVTKGFYNTDRTRPLVAILFRTLNGIIRCSGFFGHLAAPFLFLRFRSIIQTNNG
jgi:2-polyprenyl-3-methyl-5-hydroxy-6-metoxy-1,4-benzoquinol methylase